MFANVAKQYTHSKIHQEYYVDYVVSQHDKHFQIKYMQHFHVCY